MKVFHLPLLILAFSSSLQAQVPTFHEDVAPIIYNNCTLCHRVGEIGPMPLTTYNEVVPYGPYIVLETQLGHMPPWSPDHNYTSFRGERFLTAAEKQTLSDWVTGGMLEGNPAMNPGVPSYPPGSQIGVPDLVLTMPQPYLHAGDMTNQYQVFMIPTGITQAVEVRAVEIITGNSNIAHHSLLGYTNNPAIIAQAMALDAADPAPGYESFGDYSVAVDDFLFGGWVPGSMPLEFPSTIGKVMEPGSYLLLQMHYGPTPIDETDITHINIFFADQPVARQVVSSLISPIDIPEPFIIPANQIKSFHATQYVSSDVSVASIFPHSHLLGKSWLAFATSPDNLDTIPLISVPEWQFRWQGIYTFPSLVHIPGGYTLHAIGEYDNTTANLQNPNTPPIDVGWGDFTSDEMFVVFIQYVAYQPGDEFLTFNGVTPYDQGYADGFAAGMLSVVCPPAPVCPSDLDGDGSTSTTDLLVFLSAFGLICQ